MRNLATYALMLHVLLSTWAPGGLAELFRLPSLGDHYAEHFAESGGTMSWADFLVLHYTDPEHQRQDPSHHESLPFHHPVLASPSYVAPVASTFAVQLEELPVGQARMRLAEVGEWSGRSVFHPPKSVG
ncbi:MAG: hypothetical protein IPO17_16745 [Flavobacteriales bacterium]|nr:hypothetical protein [Flavobacteriales bacterium]